MADVTIVIDDTAVRQMLASAPTRINRALSLAIKDATGYIKSQMQVYPPERRYVSVTKDSKLFSRGARKVAGRKGSVWASSYRRTGTLKRSWHTSVQGTGANVEGRIYSAGAEAPYNRYVQDRTMQARIHGGRWQTAQDVASDATPVVNQMFQNRIRAEIG